VAPANADAVAISVEVRIWSARLAAAEETAPVTNPSCTAVVSHDASSREMLHSEMSEGTTTAVANQTDIASTWTAATSHS
jgi:hypothetical protein